MGPRKGTKKPNSSILSLSSTIENIDQSQATTLADSVGTASPPERSDLHQTELKAMLTDFEKRSQQFIEKMRQNCKTVLNQIETRFNFDMAKYPDHELDMNFHDFMGMIKDNEANLAQDIENRVAQKIHKPLLPKKNNNLIVKDNAKSAKLPASSGLPPLESGRPGVPSSSVKNRISQSQPRNQPGLPITGLRKRSQSQSRQASNTDNNTNVPFIQLKYFPDATPAHAYRSLKAQDRIVYSARGSPILVRPVGDRMSRKDQSKQMPPTGSTTANRSHFR